MNRKALLMPSLPHLVLARAAELDERVHAADGIPVVRDDLVNERSVRQRCGECSQRGVRVSASGCASRPPR